MNELYLNSNAAGPHSRGGRMILSSNHNLLSEDFIQEDDEDDNVSLGSSASSAATRSVNSSQLKIKQRKQQKQQHLQPQISASQSTIKSFSNNNNENVEKYYNHHHHQVRGNVVGGMVDMQSEGDPGNTILLPSRGPSNPSIVPAGVAGNRKQQAGKGLEMDMSLGQLINNSMSIMQLELTSKHKQAKPLRQDDLLINFKQSNARSIIETPKGFNQPSADPVSMNTNGISLKDVYSELKNIRQDLARVKEVKQQVLSSAAAGNGHIQEKDSESDDEHHQEDPETNLFYQSTLEQKYRFLIQNGKQLQKSRDAANVTKKVNDDQEGGGAAPSLLELNNKLIQEAYAVSKRREYVQHHIGEVEMEILDTSQGGEGQDESEESEGAFIGYSKAMELIKQGGPKGGLLDMRNKNENTDLDDSQSQNEGDHEFAGVNIHLLTDDRRLQVQVPNYDLHYRLYFDNPEAFQNQIQQFSKHSRLGQAQVGGKAIEEEKMEQENRVRQYFNRLTESEQIEMIAKVVPQFGECLRDLQQTRLKYLILLDRFKKFAPVGFKQVVQQDKLLDLLGIHQDLAQRFVTGDHNNPQGPHHFPGGAATSTSQQQAQHNQQLQRRKGTFGESSISHINNSLLGTGPGAPGGVGGGVSPNKMFVKHNQEDSHIREVQRIKEQLGDAESKLKDAQLQRLQEKVKGFAATEKQLRMTISEIEKRDESLVTKLEMAVCFGKIMITSRPFIVQDFQELLSEVKYHAMDVPMQQMLSGAKQKQEQSLPERIDETVGLKLEVEFNELYNKLRSPQALKDAGFSSRFALVSPEAQIVLYSDIHMTQEVAPKFKLSQLDFVDIGILIQNNKESQRMMFFKLVNHNVKERKREVYLMSFYEDQVPKWENCLDPSDEIKSFDRTFKIIKDRLLKAVIERSKRLQLDADQSEFLDEDYQDGDDYRWNDGDDVSAEIGSDDDQIAGRGKGATPFMKLRDMRKKTKRGRDDLASSDEDEYSHYERKYQEHVIRQSKKLHEAGVIDHSSQAAAAMLSGLNQQYSADSPPGTRQLIGKTEDLNRELDNISVSVHQKIRSKMQAEHEKEDKQRMEEQQKKLKAKEAQNQEYARAMKALTLGTTFLKYGAMGPPKQRHVFLQDNGKRICWKDPGATSKSGSRYIVVKEITEIQEGRLTKKFKRFKTESANQESVSFSLISKKRTLDLETANMQDKVKFIQNLQIIMQHALGVELKKGGNQSVDINEENVTNQQSS